MRTKTVMLLNVKRNDIDYFGLRTIHIVLLNKTTKR